MLDQNQRSVEEVFMIKTDAIQIVGSLIRETARDFSSKGAVFFQDGTFWAFQSPQGERSEIRKRLLSLFEQAAAFYGTNIIHHILEKAIPDEEIHTSNGVNQRLLH